MVTLVKKSTDYLMYFVLTTLTLTGLNVLLMILNIPFALLGSIIAVMAFIGIVGVTYAYNKFKFRSLLDLTLYSVIIAIFGLLGTSMTVLLQTETPFLMQIINGFQPLMTSVIIGGFVSAVIGMVNLKSIKKTR